MIVETRVKRCPRCAVVKPAGEFSPDGHKAGGLASKCRGCDRDLSRSYYARNRGKVLTRNREYQRARTEDRDSTYHRARARAVAVYGGCCEWCGIAEDLEFDHVDNDGGVHRQRESHREMYKRIARSGRLLEDVRLRLLCRPCHERRSAQQALLARLVAAAERLGLGLGV